MNHLNANVFNGSKDTLRLRSEEAVMSEVCDVTPLVLVKVVMAVICCEWPLSSCSRSPVWTEIEAISDTVLGAISQTAEIIPSQCITSTFHTRTRPSSPAEANLGMWDQRYASFLVFRLKWQLSSFTSSLSVAKKHWVNLCDSEELFPVGTSLPEQSHKKTSVHRPSTLTWPLTFNRLHYLLPKPTDRMSR